MPSAGRKRMSPPGSPCFVAGGKSGPRRKDKSDWPPGVPGRCSGLDQKRCNAFLFAPSPHVGIPLEAESSPGSVARRRSPASRAVRDRIEPNHCCPVPLSLCNLRWLSAAGHGQVHMAHAALWIGLRLVVGVETGLRHMADPTAPSIELNRASTRRTLWDPAARSRRESSARDATTVTEARAAAPRLESRCRRPVPSLPSRDFHRPRPTRIALPACLRSRVACIENPWTPCGADAFGRADAAATVILGPSPCPRRTRRRSRISSPVGR